jgi:hypothetical protein
VVELAVELDIIKLGKLPASTEVSKVATETNWDAGDIEGLAVLFKDVGACERTVEGLEDGVEVETVSTKALTDEVGTVAPEVGVVLIAAGVELAIDAESGVEDRSSDDAVVAMVRTAVETLSVEAETAVVDISTIDCVKLETLELASLGVRDGEVDVANDVSIAIPMAFAMNRSILRPGFSANTMPC